MLYYSRLIFVLLFVIFKVDSDNSCISVLNYGFDKLLPCTAKCTNSSANNTLYNWSLSKKNHHWGWSNKTFTSSLAGYYQVDVDNNQLHEVPVVVFSNGTLLLRGDLWYSSTMLTCSINNSDGSICDSVELTLTVLIPNIHSTQRIGYPLQSTGIDLFKVNYIGQPFMLCLEGTTNGLFDNRNLTFWSKGQTSFLPREVTTNCTSCPCLVSEIKKRKEEKRVNFYLSLYKTNPCLQKQDKLLTILHITNTLPSDTNGLYKFQYTDYTGRRLPLENKEYNLTVGGYISIPPVFTGFNQSVISSFTDQLTLYCNATVSVGQDIEWVGQEEEPINHCTHECAPCNGSYRIYQKLIRVVISRSVNDTAYVSNVSKALVICNINRSMQEMYYCQLVNDTSYRQTVTIIQKPTPSFTSSPPTLQNGSSLLFRLLVPVIAFTLLILIVIVTCGIVYFIKTKKSSTTMLKRLQVTNPVMILPEKQQLVADPLEFPRDRLHFKELIGEGQFGQVWKVQAIGIIPDDPTRNIVAVKTTKDSCSHFDVEDLLDELEVMKKLEPHPNILNLLGYCTDNHPYYIIMEYALHGNLKNYLRSLKTLTTTPMNETHNKLLRNYLLLKEQNHQTVDDTMSERYDHLCWCEVTKGDCLYCTGNTGTCTCATTNRSYVNVPNYNEIKGTCVMKQHVHYNTDHMIDHMTIGIDHMTNGIDHMTIGIDHMTNGIDHMTNEIRNMTDDVILHHNESSNALSDKDIYNFALQISCGMEHLQKLKCIHRDLAARNVLIAEGYILKIADFGLARELDDDKQYYKRLTSGKLPARWMALESLDSRQTHTHKSDVWSFGVVLWEILTYGDVPYGGQGEVATSLESLIHYIQNGNRLPRPDNCSDEMYQLLLNCWDMTPAKRPSFSELVTIFDGLLSAAHGYLPLTDDHTDLSPQNTTEEDTTSTNRDT